MTASIKVYDNDLSNTLMFDSYRATIPTFFKKRDFKLADIEVVGSGFDRYGKVTVYGLTPGTHFCFSVQSPNLELNNTLPSMTSHIYPNIMAGYLRISYDLLLTLQWLNTYYPNADYFVTILELH